MSLTTSHKYIAQMARLSQIIRRNKLINKIVRVMIKKIFISFNNALIRIQKKWTTSGVIDCSFNSASFKMYNECDDGLVNYFYYNLNYYESSSLTLFLRLTKYSNCIFDIGANTGLFSILASKTNGKASIYAFEPYDVNASRMELNLKLNDLENVTVVKEALGEIVGEIVLSVPSNRSITDVSSVNDVFSKEIYPELTWDLIKTACNTVDNYRKKLNTRIDLIKCDVETFEMSVFSGALHTISNDRPIIIFESFMDEPRVDFFNKILSDYGYFLYVILHNELVYCSEGVPKSFKVLNYLLSPVRPTRTLISFADSELWSLISESQDNAC